MSDGLWVGLAALLVLILVTVAEAVVYWNAGGWLDVRASQTADDVRRNIADHGPEMPGLKLDLLPEPERRAVLADRARRAEERARQREARR
jgi:hypothetical protein